MKKMCFFRILAPIVLFLCSLHCACSWETRIEGSPRFTNQVHKAMLLLKTHDPEAYAIVTNYVGRIKQAKRSGMWSKKRIPTYEMSDVTAFYSLTWCAATIAHDSFHSKLYHDYRRTNGVPVPRDIHGGLIAEQKCMAHQIAVMKRIGASREEIEHAEKMADGHYAKDNETWADYKKRKW